MPIMPFPLSWQNSTIIFPTIQPFQFAKKQSLFNCQMCHVHMQSDVPRNMYPIPTVYQRIFNQLVQILHWLVDSDRFWAFGENRVILLQTVSKCAFFSGPRCSATHGIAKAFLSVCLSVCLSVKRVQCDKTKETWADILMPYAWKNVYPIRQKEWLVGDDRLKFGPNWPRCSKNADFQSIFFFLLWKHSSTNCRAFSDRRVSTVRTRTDPIGASTAAFSRKLALLWIYETETIGDRDGQMHGRRRAEIVRVILLQLNGLTRPDRSGRPGSTRYKPRDISLMHTLTAALLMRLLILRHLSSPPGSPPAGTFIPW